MNREKAKELLPIIQAFAEGDEIQYRNNYNEWIDVKTGEGLCFTRPSSCYRIKPEPKCRPFKSQEECWQEMHKHPDFGWLYTKKNKYYVNIGAMGDYVGMNGQKYDSAFENYTFTDGTPFGIKEE